jgi:hypothetical protein
MFAVSILIALWRGVAEPAVARDPAAAWLSLPVQEEACLPWSEPSSTPVLDDPDLCAGWPVCVNTPGAGFPYTPTLFDIDGDGASEVFFTGGHTFGLRGDGSFLPGWPVTEMLYMGYGTNGQMPGPSCGDVTGDGTVAVLWSERDWYAGSSHMWSFNGRLPDGDNLGSFPLEAPDQFSNALDSPFVLGDSDDDGDLEAWSAHTLGNTGDYYRISGFDHEGGLLFTTDLNPAEDILNLYFGDPAGDGQEEFFAVTILNGVFRLFAFDPEGQAQPGYPVDLCAPGGGSLMFGPPLAVDLSGDGDLEIILGYNLGTTSYAQARHHDGSPVEGFPMTIASQSQLFYLGLGDVTGDQVPELIAFDNHLTSGYRIHVLDMATGDLLPGWPVALPDWPEGFPTVVDADGDGFQDIVFVTDGGALHALAGDGSERTGYPKSMSAPSISGAAAGDIDGDGCYELVAVTWNGWAYAWNTPAEVAEGTADWPMRGVDAQNTGVFTGSGGSTGATPVEPLPTVLGLIANPVTGSAVFTIPAGVDGGSVSVFDGSGRLAARLSVDSMDRATWNPGATDPDGVYFARLISDSGTATVAFILLR